MFSFYSTYLVVACSILSVNLLPWFGTLRLSQVILLPWVVTRRLLPVDSFFSCNPSSAPSDTPSFHLIACNLLQTHPLLSPSYQQPIDLLAVLSLFSSFIAFIRTDLLVLVLSSQSGICIKSTNLLKAMRRFWDFVTNAYAEITSAMTPKLIEIRHNLSQDILARKKDPCQAKALQVVQVTYAVDVRRT